MMKPRIVLKKLENKIVFFASSSLNGKPNLVSVQINKFVSPNKIIFTDNMLKKTRKNLGTNPNVAFALNIGSNWFQFKGSAKRITSGKYFDLVRSLPGNKKYFPKAAVLVSVKEVFDLDKGKKVL